MLGEETLRYREEILDTLKKSNFFPYFEIMPMTKIKTSLDGESKIEKTVQVQWYYFDVFEEIELKNLHKVKWKIKKQTSDVFMKKTKGIKKIESVDQESLPLSETSETEENIDSVLSRSSLPSRFQKSGIKKQKSYEEEKVMRKKCGENGRRNEKIPLIEFRHKEIEEYETQKEKFIDRGQAVIYVLDKLVKIGKVYRKKFDEFDLLNVFQKCDY